MSKKLLQIIALGLVSFFLISCNQPANKVPVIKKGIAPVADTEVAIIEMEQAVYGKFTIELYSNIAPEMVKRFKELAREGFYNGTIIHRIDAEVVQGGDPLSKDATSKLIGSGKSKKPDVPAEFSDIFYDSGIVGAARTENVDSQNCQFFVTLRRVKGFDQNYTIFGKIVDGMNNVRTIAGAPRDGKRPIEDIRIKSVIIQTKEK
ncbi:MAG: peptidylprolyl isomerase [Acidobacteriota bacterium]